MSSRIILAGAFPLILAASGLAIAGGAHATVFTVARAVDAYSNAYGFSGYNVTYDGSGNRSIGLFGVTKGQSFGYNCPGCTESSSGTGGAGTNATASFDHARTTVPFVGGGTAIGEAFARANLTTGQLGVLAVGQSYPISGYTSGVEGQSLAGFADGLNFSVAGAGPTTVTDIGVTLDLHGSMSASAFLQEQLLFQSPGISDAQLINQISSSVTTIPVISYSNASGWVSESFSPFTPSHLVFHGVYALTGPSQHVDISEFLYAEAGNGVSDYAHTSDFSFSLPSNVTFTSTSGAFLTGAVPEPATWTMMLIGVGGLGAAMRARRGKGGALAAT